MCTTACVLVVVSVGEEDGWHRDGDGQHLPPGGTEGVLERQRNQRAQDHARECHQVSLLRGVQGRDMSGTIGRAELVNVKLSYAPQTNVFFFPRRKMCTFRGMILFDFHMVPVCTVPSFGHCLVLGKRFAPALPDFFVFFCFFL